MPRTRARTADALDFYRTPEWAVVRFLSAWAPTIEAPRAILEPAAGDGALLGPLRRTWPEATIDAFDIQPGSDVVRERAFWFDDEPHGYDLVITNPPYSLAASFVTYGLRKLNRGGWLVLHGRDGWLNAKERAWVPVPVAKYTLRERPSYRGESTDFTESAWFVFRKGARRKWYRGFWI